MCFGVSDSLRVSIRLCSTFEFDFAPDNNMDSVLCVAELFRSSPEQYSLRSEGHHSRYSWTRYLHIQYGIAPMIQPVNATARPSDNLEPRPTLHVMTSALIRHVRKYSLRDRVSSHASVGIDESSAITWHQELRVIRISWVRRHNFERCAKKVTNVPKKLNPVAAGWSAPQAEHQPLIKKRSYVRGLNWPIFTLPTSSLPNTIISSTRYWCFLSTHPPLLISTSRAREAASAISSGVPPGTETASELCNTDVVDSARRLSA